MAQTIYSKAQLYAPYKPRVYREDAAQAAFLLGGIGTGNFSIGARGEMRDWEIFSRPNKGNAAPYTFFAIWAKPAGGKSVARVLEAEIQPPYARSHGFAANEVAGLPRFRSSRMRAEYPFLQVDFDDDALPLDVSLEAFTPFIPLNADDSGIPAAILRYRVRNRGRRPVDVSVAGSLANMTGFRGVKPGRNDYRDEKLLRGLFYSTPEVDSGARYYGTMALITTDTPVSVKPVWLDGGWWDGGHDFWDDFAGDGKLEAANYGKIEIPERQPLKIGSVAPRARLRGGEEKVFQFVIAWHFPNRWRCWEHEGCDGSGNVPIVRNHYATKFADAWEAGRYLVENLPRLEKVSGEFRRALYSSSVPGAVIEALAAGITVIRSPTCFRLEDGTLQGWEGCSDTWGCCHGSCTHVWNYAQTLAFLFPELEQTMRRVEFGLETDETGNMAFRSEQVFGRERWKYHPAADGQNGSIVRMYRDWKISGNSELLRELWPKVAKALDFAFEYWDSDKDFVLDSQQHNTYDIEFYGPNSLTNSMFFAALKAGSEMAGFLGDVAHAARWSKALEEGSRKMDALLWGGEYYVQKLENVNDRRYQYGKGCLSDQLLGQLLAHVAGLGYILPADHVKHAVQSIFKHNFRREMRRHTNPQRTYALNGEAGLVLCTWPNGGRPRLPFPYCDEVWTGFEYQVAAHLIYEGFVDEGLTIVKAARDRHDGYRRNPWNQVECGHHYARSMSSWAVLLALSGFRYDMVRGTMGFNPVTGTGDFSTFWSTGRAWGTCRQKRNRKTGRIERKVKVLYGSLNGVKVEGC